jgi:hypothetical protein
MGEVHGTLSVGQSCLQATVRLVKNIYSVPDDKTDQRAKSKLKPQSLALYPTILCISAMSLNTIL